MLGKELSKDDSESGKIFGADSVTQDEQNDWTINISFFFLNGDDIKSQSCTAGSVIYQAIEELSSIVKRARILAKNFYKKDSPRSITALLEIFPPTYPNGMHGKCNDLIRIGIFMKDTLDSAIDKGADLKILGFQCVDHTVDFYMITRSGLSLSTH
ncbi:hypothetical protein G9A89_017865 [Geosiphon pyriformis]|nr:hypothetical protein G9A89_017865 [Geosiphon pyriformis]